MTSLRLTHPLDPDAAPVHLREVDTPAAYGRPFRATAVIEYTGTDGTHTVLVSGPLTTATGGDHPEMQGSVAYQLTPDGRYVDADGRTLFPDLARLVRGPEALDALGFQVVTLAGAPR